MPEEVVVTYPLVRVNMSESPRDESMTRVRYFIGDECVGDLDIDSTWLPLSADPQHYPVMALAQIFVTPHEHLAVISDFLAVANAIDPTSLPIDQSHWSSLIQKAEMLLNPPPVEE